MIEARLSDADFVIAEVANAVNLSQSRLCQLMRKDSRLSVKAYIMSRRLVRARKLLHETFKTVKEVMVCVGMSDASHFCKLYKREFGVNPSQDRERKAEEIVRNSVES